MYSSKFDVVPDGRGSYQNMAPASYGAKELAHALGYSAMKPWRQRTARAGIDPSPEMAARLEREDALQFEAIRVFVSESAALQWALRPTHDLGGWQTPTECAGASQDGLEKAIAYLHELGIDPLPPDPPSPWKGKQSQFRRARR